MGLIFTSYPEDLHKYGPVYTVTCLSPVYEESKQFLIFAEISWWYYSRHPYCVLSSFTSSKSKPIFSKYVFTFPFNHSSKYPRYYLCCMCDEAECAKERCILNLLASSLRQSLWHKWSPWTNVRLQIYCWPVLSSVWDHIFSKTSLYSQVHHHFLQPYYPSSLWWIFPLHFAKYKGLPRLNIFPLHIRILGFLVD